MYEFGFISVKWFGLVKVNNECIVLFKIFLFSLGLNFSLQFKSWPKAEHYIHCGILPPPTETLKRVLDLVGG